MTTPVNPLFPGVAVGPQPTPPTPPAPLKPEEIFVEEFFGYNGQAPTSSPYVITKLTNYNDPLAPTTRTENLEYCVTLDCGTKLAALIGPVNGWAPTVTQDWPDWAGVPAGCLYSGGINGTGKVAYVDFAQATNGSGQLGWWGHLNAGLDILDFFRVCDPTTALIYARNSILMGFQAAGILQNT